MEVNTWAHGTELQWLHDLHLKIGLETPAGRFIGFYFEIQSSPKRSHSVILIFVFHSINSLLKIKLHGLSPPERPPLIGKVCANFCG
jgi:hypothetical protein